MPFTLAFKHPFKIAHGVRTSTPVVFTRIEHKGVVGYGEIAMPPYLGETHETAQFFLTQAAEILKHLDPLTPIVDILKLIDAIAEGNTAAKAGIDIALHDLYGKLSGAPCYKFWKLNPADTPYTTYTIGMDTPDVVKQKVVEGAQYKFFKVKLGGNQDKELIEAIRSVTDKPLMVDANQGWKSKEDALKMIEWLATKKVELIEQPLPKDNLDDAFWLKERSPLPVIADEACQRLVDVRKIKDAYHGINIKLMKCTGLHEAHEMIVKARLMGLKILIGCMSETSCGVSAAAQLTPLADWADLDGPLLISNDVFSGIQFVHGGKIQLNNKPGIGVTSLLMDF